MKSKERHRPHHGKETDTRDHKFSPLRKQLAVAGRARGPLIATALVLALVSSSFGQTTNIWDGSKDSKWSGGPSSQNWSQGSPSSGQVLQFSGNVRTTNSNNTTAGTSYGGIQFGTNAGTFVISGNDITLGGDIINNSTNLQTLNLNLILSGNRTFNTASNSITIEGGISGAFALVKSGSGTLFLANSNSYSGGTILNAGSIAISNNASLGTGTVSFASNSAVAALTNLTVTNNYSIATNATTTLDTRAFSLTNSGNITGAGSLAKVGSGTLVLGGSNNYTGLTTISAGLLYLGNTNALGGSTLSFNSGALSFGLLTGANFGGLQGSGNLILTNSSGTRVALSVGANNASTTYSGALSGTSATLTKRGTGSLTLSGSNSYTGGTTISGGSIAFTGSNSVGSGPVSLSGGSSFSYAGSSATTLANEISVTTGTGIIGSSSASLLTLSGILTHSGSIIEFYGGSYNVTGKITGSAANSDLLLSNAAVTLSYSGNDYNGATKLYNGSILTAGAANALPTNGILTVGGAGESSTLTNSFDLNGYSQRVGGLYSGTGSYDQILNSAGTAATLSLGGNSSFGGSIKGSNLGLTVASGMTGLFGSNSYTGATTVGSGASLNLTNTGSLNGTTNVALNGGTLLLGAGNQVKSGVALSMSAGSTLSMGGNASTRASSQTFGALTLTGNSVLDFANLSGTSSLTFSSITGLSGSNTLSVWNWNGTSSWYPTSTTGGVGQYTHLYDLGSLSPAQLSNISFYIGSGTGLLGTGQFAGNEIVPVPEPAVLVSALLILGTLVWHRRFS